MTAALRLGTRGSALALAQAGLVRRALEELGTNVELVEITTSGDARPGREQPQATGDKSRFVKEIEQALLAGEVDLAVHSAKDVPGELPPGLAIAGVPERGDARDALCVSGGATAATVEGLAAGSLEGLPDGARVGTASLRRRAQLLAARPDLQVSELHGNVDTRLRRLGGAELDAIVLASAGLARLGRAEGSPVALELMTPAPGQGCLALEARSDDARVGELARRLTDEDALRALTAERALVVGIGASCRTPVGAYAALDGGGLRLEAFAGMPDGSRWIRDTVEGSPAEAAALGRAAAERLLAAG
ncbi:MAG: hydroxymethylbilane synthase, partial [Thermoleophilaceae bacterium]